MHATKKSVFLAAPSALLFIRPHLLDLFVISDRFAFSEKFWVFNMEKKNLKKGQLVYVLYNGEWREGVAKDPDATGHSYNIKWRAPFESEKPVRMLRWV